MNINEIIEFIKSNPEIEIKISRFFDRNPSSSPEGTI